MDKFTFARDMLSIHIMLNVDSHNNGKIAKAGPMKNVKSWS